MANDPAFLFYPGDYLRDTQCLSERSQVAYDRIMCEHMRNICITQAQLEFFTKRFTVEEKSELMMVIKPTDGGFHIAWVTDSITKRREYSESRRNNRRSKPKNARNISSSHDKHMDNENEDAIENEEEDASIEKSENLFFGDVPPELIELAGRLQPKASAGEWQRYVQDALQSAGYDVDREVPCKYPDGSEGRIDLVVWKDDFQIAVELDYRVARKNSIVKVKTYPAGMVLLRDPKFVKSPIKLPKSEILPGELIWRDQRYREESLYPLAQGYGVINLEEVLSAWEGHYVNKYEWRKKTLQEMRLSFESWIKNPITVSQNGKRKTSDDKATDNFANSMDTVQRIYGITPK